MALIFYTHFEFLKITDLKQKLKRHCQKEKIIYYPRGPMFLEKDRPRDYQSRSPESCHYLLEATADSHEQASRPTTAPTSNERLRTEGLFSSSSRQSTTASVEAVTCPAKKTILQNGHSRFRVHPNRARYTIHLLRIKIQSAAWAMAPWNMCTVQSYLCLSQICLSI